MKGLNLGKIISKARGRNAVKSAVRSLKLETLEGRTLMSAYMVSTSGSDSNAGTASAPWRTLQKAADTVKAGDVVTVNAGDYEGFSAFSLRGTASAPIKFIANGDVNITTRATRQSAIDVGIELSGYDSSSGSAYVEIEGFTVNNASGTISGGGSSGFRVRYSNNITLRNCKALNNGWVGMYSAYNNGLTIDGGESAYNNAYVDSSTQRNHGIYVANSSSNVTVRNIYVHDNNGNGIHNNGDGGVNRNILIENNRVAGNGANGGSAINNDGIVNSIIRNNILWNNKNKGIALYSIDAAGGSTGNTIVNNTVVQASGNAALQLKDGASATVYNNILINTVGVAVDFANDSISGTTFDYNIYGGRLSGDGSSQDLASWRGNYGWDSHSSTGTSAALFVNAGAGDLHLLTSAAALDKGTTVSAPATDFEGDARPSGNGVDIGADELLAGPVLAPAAPSGLSATPASTTRINLTWSDNSLTETGFKIERSVNGGAFAQIATVGAGVTSFGDTGLVAGTQYSYRIRAYNITGDSGYSNTADATTAAQETTPTAPSALLASAASASAVTLTWTDSATNETGFKIERSVNGGAYTQIATVGADVTTYSDSGLTASTTYAYRVHATNATGDSAYSNIASATTLAVPPASPNQLAATAISSSQIDLTWADNSTNETGFRIDRSTDGLNFTQVATVGANVTNFSNTGLTENTSYTYRVRAYNAAGNSAWSNLALVQTLTNIVAPAAPSNLVATANGASQITLTWQDNSLTDTGFKIERSVNGGAYTQIGTIGALGSLLGTTTYVDSGLAEGTTYSYRVRATSLLADSDYSNVASATTATSVPGAPSNLTATATDSSTIVLNWLDNSTTEIGFEIERQDAPNGQWIPIGVAGPDVTSYTDQSLAENTLYSYRVHAASYRGDSPDSNIASATTGVTRPNAPFGLSASLSGTTGATLTWFDDSTNESAFKIERSTDGVNFTTIATVGADITTFVDSGLAAGTTYTYRVLATNSAGDSGYTNDSSIVTPAAPVVLVPTSPNQLSATANDETRIELAWADNSSNETGFRLDRSSNGVNFMQIATLGADVSSYSDTNVMPGVTYTYRIKAFNTAASSVWSNLASAKTTLTAPATPTDLIATTTASSVTLNWSDNAGNETAYAIERRLASDATGWTQITTLGANSTSFTDAGLPESTSYVYRVRATRTGAPTSGYSNEVAASTLATPPLAPTLLASRAADADSISLNWTDNSFNEDGFVMERSTDGETWIEFMTFDSDSTSHVDFGLDEGTTYLYRVASLNTAGLSEWSNITQATTPVTVPLAPGDLVATNVAFDRVTLSWKDNSFNETGFEIGRAGDDGSFVQIATVDAGVTSFTDNTVAEGVSYRYVVVATNAAGESAITNIASVTTPLSVPLAPTNPMAFVADAYHIDLAWTDNAFNEAGYRIERSINGGEYVHVATLAAGAQSYSDAGLSENTTYSYRIGAFNSDGESSALVVATTPATIPAAPSDVAATANTPTKITITWTDNSFNETEFTVQRSQDSMNWETIGAAPAGTLGYLDEGLTPGTTYFYRIASTNSAGSSDFSPLATAVTSNAAPVAASDLIVVESGYTQLVLSWTDNATNELAYRIERSTAGGEFTTIATVGANVISYVDSGLSSSTSYAYRVVAYNIIGDSPYSNTATGQTLTDVAGPTAVLSASNVTVGGATTYRFTVTYSDLVAVNVASIDRNDILVTGPHGYRQRRATLLSVMQLEGGSAVATYSLVAPKGTWDAKDNGTYKFSLQSNQVTDVVGNVSPARVLGFFSASISSIGGGFNGSSDLTSDDSLLDLSIVDIATENDTWGENEADLVLDLEPTSVL